MYQALFPPPLHKSLRMWLVYSRLTRELGACTNGVYQALFPPPPHKSLRMWLVYSTTTRDKPSITAFPDRSSLCKGYMYKPNSSDENQEINYLQTLVFLHGYQLPSPTCCSKQQAQRKIQHFRLNQTHQPTCITEINTTRFRSSTQHHQHTSHPS